VEASDPLARAAGHTAVLLSLMELVLAKALVPKWFQESGEDGEDLARQENALLRAASRKANALEFLLKLRQYHRKRFNTDPVWRDLAEEEVG